MNKRDVLAMLVSLAFTSAVSLAQAEQGIDPAVSNDEGAAAEAYSSSGVAQSTLKLADSDEFEGGLNSAIEYPRQRFREEASIEGGLNSPIGVPASHNAASQGEDGGLVKAGFSPASSRGDTSGGNSDSGNAARFEPDDGCVPGSGVRAEAL